MKTYKVKNESGQLYEVDEDKLSDAEKDGYLPVVSNGKEEHRVSSSDLDKAIADGYQPQVTIAAPEVSQLESLGRGALQGASFGFSDEIVGGLESLFTDKTYEQARDESRANNDAAKEANPSTYMTGDIGASIATSFVPGFGALNAAKGAKLATAMGKGALQGGLAGAGYSDADLTDGDVKGFVKDTAVGAGIGAAVPAAFRGAGVALDKTGATDKAKVVAKYLNDKFHTATDGAADIFSLAPKGTTKKVREMGWAERERIRNLSPDDLENQILKAKDDIEDVFTKAEPEIQNYRTKMEKAALEDIYAEDADMIKSFGNITPADAKTRIAASADDIAMLRNKMEADANAMVGFQTELDDALKKLDANDTFYTGSTKKTLKNVKETLTKGGPLEYGIKKVPNENPLIQSLDSMTEYKRRVLNSRREIDDLLKNKDIEKLGRHDVDALLDTREKMNKFLQEDMAGASKMAEADALWANWAKGKENVLDPIKSVERNSVSSDKLDRLMRRNTFKRDEWLDASKNHFDSLKKAVEDNPELARSIDAIGKNIQTLSVDIQNKQFLDNLTLIGGGPTGKAVKGLLHAAGFAGGFWNPMVWVADAAAMPLSDPDRWFRIKDVMLKAADGAGNTKAVQSFIGLVESSSDALMKSSPRVATQAYLLNKKKDEPK